MTGDLGGIIYLLVYLLVACLFVGFAFWALDRGKVPEPYRMIVVVIILLVALLFVLRVLGLF